MDLIAATTFSVVNVMCRLLFTYKRVPKPYLNPILEEFQNFYRRYCGTDRLSYGALGFNNTSISDVRGTGLPECDHLQFPKMPFKYAMYHIRYRNGPGVTSIANTHPFVLDRYIFMHNGRIKSLDNQNNKTDSELFFELIILLHTGTTTLKDALNKALLQLPKKPKPLINMVMFDKYTGEFIVYHHSSGVPSLFWDSQRGIVANWQIPNSKEIKMLWRPAYNRKPDPHHRPVGE